VVFAYRRPVHARRVVDALLLNPEAKDTDLIVFIDGPKSNLEQLLIDEVIEVFSSLTGFASVEIHKSSINLGLAKSLIQGISSVLELYDRVIVIEDDIVVAPNFLNYMNAGLKLYENDSRVASIHGYVYPIQEHLPSTFFIRGADCWGWATWRRAWQKFNPDGSALLKQLMDSNLTNEFDFGGSAHYTNMLRGQIAGKNDSWAVRWYASAFLESMLTLYPGVSLVENIGLDGSGTHSGASTMFQTQLADNLEGVIPIEIRESELARAAFSNFFISVGQGKDQNLGQRILMKIFRGLRKHC
jgi:hypothetical protein